MEEMAFITAIKIYFTQFLSLDKNSIILRLFSIESFNYLNESKLEHIFKDPPLSFDYRSFIKIL